MTVLSAILMALSGLALVVWASRHGLITREHRRGSILRADRPGPGDDELPPVSVLVAAKDEQDNIAPCVRSMLEQDYPTLEMIVVNDRSEDRTAQIVEGIIPESGGRLKLVNIEHLPEGWCGKNNAMHNGVAGAAHEWICMIDADCKQTSNRSLRAAVGYAMETAADLLSVLPNLEVRTFWENIVQPVCSGVMMIWFNPNKVNDPARPHAYANGAFMLMRREAYEQIGGHEAVKGQVNEDMHMAALVKNAGLRLRVIRNDGLYSVRMYDSLRAILRGWSRIFYGTFGTLRRLTTSLAALMIMGITPYVAAGVGLAGWAAGASPAWLLASCGLAGAAAAGVQISVMLRFYELTGARWWLGWTYPLGCLIGTVALLGAMGKLRRGARISWKNTHYSRPAS